MYALCVLFPPSTTKMFMNIQILQIHKCPLVTSHAYMLTKLCRLYPFMTDHTCLHITSLSKMLRRQDMPWCWAIGGIPSEGMLQRLGGSNWHVGQSTQNGVLGEAMLFCEVLVCWPLRECLVVLGALSEPRVGHPYIQRFIMFMFPIKMAIWVA